MRVISGTMGLNSNLGAFDTPHLLTKMSELEIKSVFILTNFVSANEIKFEIK